MFQKQGDLLRKLSLAAKGKEVAAAAVVAVMAMAAVAVGGCGGSGGCGGCGDRGPNSGQRNLHREIKLQKRVSKFCCCGHHPKNI